MNTTSASKFNMYFQEFQQEFKLMSQYSKDCFYTMLKTFTCAFYKNNTEIVHASLLIIIGWLCILSYTFSKCPVNTPIKKLKIKEIRELIDLKDEFDEAMVSKDEFDGIVEKEAIVSQDAISLKKKVNYNRVESKEQEREWCRAKYGSSWHKNGLNKIRRKEARYALVGTKTV
jgi:hypothetical protein